MKINPGSSDSQKLRQKAEAAGYNFRYIDDKTVGISVDETTSDDDIKQIVNIFGGELNTTHSTQLPAPLADLDEGTAGEGAGAWILTGGAVDGPTDADPPPPPPKNRDACGSSVIVISTWSVPVCPSESVTVTMRINTPGPICVAITVVSFPVVKVPDLNLIVQLN